MTVTSARPWSRWRTAFRHWRRGRPFWSGLLLIGSGIELFLSANMDLGDLQVHLGYEGFLSYVIPMIMVLVGIFVWVTPAQRAFYGILGTATAVYSLIGLNLGGWFLGMLLGIVGGALAFAWTTQSPDDSPATASDTTTGPRAATTSDADVMRDVAAGAGKNVAAGAGNNGAFVADSDGAAVADSDGAATARGTGLRAPGRHSRGSNGMLLVVPLLLVLSVGLVATPAPAAASCPAPTATPTATATPTWQPGDLLRLLWEKLFPKPTPTCTGQPPSPTGSTAPSGSAGPGFASPATNPSATGRPGPSTSADAGSSPPARPPTVARVGAGQPVVAATAGKLTTSTLTLEGFSYDGVATLPTSLGTVRALKFTMSKATNANFSLLVNGGDRTLKIKSNPLIARGHVSFYTSRFSGRLLGIPLTFTPDSPPPLTLPYMVFTEVTVDLVFLDCDVLEAPTLDQVWIV